MKKLLTPVLLGLSLVSYAAAQEIGHKKSTQSQTGWLYGVGVLSSTQIYKNTSSKQTIIPVIGYKGEQLSVFGPFVSYALTNDRPVNLSLRLTPRFQSYDESDSTIFSGMESRQNSIDIGVDIGWKPGPWRANLRSMTDILGRSKGTEIQSKLGYFKAFGPFFFEPAFQLNWLSHNHVDYYYGVKQNEVTTDRPAFRGKNALSYAFDLSFSTPVLFGGFTRLGLSHTRYPDQVTDSPLVDSDNNVSVRLFYTRFF